MAVVHYHKELSPVDTLTQAAPPTVTRSTGLKSILAWLRPRLPRSFWNWRSRESFPVVYYYHFAFLAISIALFGLGRGRRVLVCVAGWKGSLYRQDYGMLASLNAVAIVLCFLFC